jgi:hypothetical protein
VPLDQRSRKRYVRGVVTAAEWRGVKRYEGDHKVNDAEGSWNLPRVPG